MEPEQASPVLELFSFLENNQESQVTQARNLTKQVKYYAHI